MIEQIRPQKGFQEMALSTRADIAILGGAAGCGKTFTLLLECGRNTVNAEFGATVFRRTMPQIKAQGGLWDASRKLYPKWGAKERESLHDWRWPSGASVSFRQLEYEKDVNNYQGAEIPLICFDELTHFTAYMFFYMLSRNRSTCGVNPYVRATCNPDPDSWVAEFIKWWIDEETGFPIKERAGKIRYMARDGDKVIWGDTIEEVVKQAPHVFENEAVKLSGVDVKDLVKSVTFIPGNIHENQKLLSVNPAYLGNLLAMTEAERAMLLDGNWKIRVDGLGLFTYKAIGDVFDNYPESNPRAAKCITVDPARFGRDFCVIMVWKGWEVIHIEVFKKSDANDIVERLEFLRRRFNIMRSDVIVDQDGVGGGTVKIGQYTGFHGGAHAMADPDNPEIVEFYKNLKTQCYYRISERVNYGQIRINVTNENCVVYDDSSLKGVYTTKIKVGSEVKDIRDLIKEDLKAIKRAKPDQEGKKQINTKEEQKIILGRSPDFGDTIMMREYVYLCGEPSSMRRVA